MERQVMVRTTHGMVLGTNDGRVSVFRGIPYGGDCSGAKRFLPPEPASSWEGVRDCTKNGNYAVQYGTSISGSDFLGDYFSGGHPEIFGIADEQQSENCLVLNVVTPGTEEEKRPVLVYIHGGGFATGSGTLVLGSGTMAVDEDIVIVGINHRLNVFGYLYLGDFDERYAQSGMAGMLDLVLALEWVRDNIRSFGGDPKKVTIMGESGGGMKVSTLMAMPKARGLFRAAIVESGSNAVGRLSPKEAAKTAEIVLERLNISPGHLELLEQCTSEQILKASGGGDGFGSMLNFGPVADGINLAWQKEDRIMASEISKDIPLMVGSSEDELAVFAPMDVIEKITWENLREMLLTGGHGMLAGLGGAPLPESEVDNVIEVFRQTNRKKDSASHLYLKIISLSGFLGGGSWYQAWTKAEQMGAPVYHYVVAYDAPLPGQPGVETSGRKSAALQAGLKLEETQQNGKKFAWHTADLPLQMRIVLHPECEAISKTMSRAIGAFVRTGDPSTPELIWPAFNTQTRQVMVFDDVCRVETDPWKEMRECLEACERG